MTLDFFNYFMFQHQKHGIISLGRYMYQKMGKMIKKIDDNDRVIINTCRQSGVSTTLTAYALRHLLLDVNSNILFISFNDKIAVRHKRQFDFALQSLFTSKWPIEKNTKHEVHLKPSGRITFTGADSAAYTARGNSYSLIICDDCAYFRDLEETLAVVESRGGKIVLNSGSRKGTYYEKLWKKPGGYKKVAINWKDIPYYTENPDRIRLIKRMMTPEQFKREMLRKFV